MQVHQMALDHFYFLQIDKSNEVKVLLLSVNLEMVLRYIK